VIPVSLSVGTPPPVFTLRQNQAMNLKFIATASKACPVCGMATMKNEGCNKMSCTNCGKAWCWKCNQVGCVGREEC
jgi:hypothetical protein